MEREDPEHLGAPLEGDTPDFGDASTTESSAATHEESLSTISDAHALGDDSPAAPDAISSTEMRVLVASLAAKAGDVTPKWIGHYELLGELGRGGMGEVHLARDSKLDRKVAIKRLLGGSGHKRRFIREAQAMAKLSHPNVISIYEIEEFGASTFIVMEFIEGQTLRAWQRTPRTRADVLAVYHAAARGLIAAHDKSLVHRDFKPDNVMIGNDGRVRVMDFGLVTEVRESNEAADRTAFNPLTRSGTILGTPAYMSPEQFRSEPADAASDQFAFCVALYEALYGERPFGGGSFGELCAAVIAGAMRSAPADSSVPAWLREIVCRGLAPRREDRFDSMQALLDALVEAEREQEFGRSRVEPPKYVFVSYAPVDTLLAMQLGRALLVHGVRPWLEIWDGRAGDAEQRMHEAEVVLVCEARGVGAEPLEHAGRVIRVRFGRSTKGQLEVEFGDGSQGVEALAEHIGVDRERDRWLTLEAEALGVEPSQLRPYRGLEVFREQHVRWMFGRDEELAKLVELVGKQSLLTVIGASGSGKSSLVLGGLCAAMRCGMLGERIDKIGTMRPGKRPCWAMAETIAGLEPSLDALSRGAKVDEMVEGMKRSKERLRAVAGQLGGAGAERRVLLVVDQLEELFTESRLGMEGEVDEALPFVHNVIAATSGDDAPLWVVFTLRSDFVPHYLRIAEFATTFNEGGCFALRPMQSSQVREAIELPAARVGFTVEQGVVVKLVNGTAEHTGRLPLLEYVLEELWNRRDVASRALTLEAYEETGGLDKAITQSAERGLAKLRERLGEQRAVAATRRVMLRLVNVGESTDGDTRRQASVVDLGRGDEQTREVLDVLVREVRVLVSDRVDGREVIEIAHEALLREWSTLRGWLDADREALRMRDAIGRAAKEYAVGKSWEYLWGKARVDEVRRVIAKSSVELDAREQRFLDSSWRVAWGTLVGAIVVGGALVIVASVAYVLVSRMSRDAEEQKVAFVAEQKSLRASMMVSNGDSYFDAAVLSLEAVGALSLDPAHPPSAPALGGLLAVMASEPAFELSILSGHSDDVTGVAFSPDSSRLATSSVDNTARVWDVASGRLLSTLSGHSDDVTGVSFSPDGTRLATSSVDNTVRVWDVASGRLLSTLSGHSDDVTGVAFSPDRTRLATSSVDNTARVWDVASGKLLSTLSGHSDDVTGVAFSPDGTRLATSSVDNTARVWDVASSKLLSTLSGHSDDVTGVAFSPDGSCIATSSVDNTARVWSVASGKLLSTLSGHSDDVTGVAFSPDGSRLATSSVDTARVWDVASGRLLSTLSTLSRISQNVTGVAFSPDGTRLATSSVDDTARVWDVASGKLLSTLSGHSSVTGVTFSFDGAHLATSSVDDTARVWDVASGRLLSTLSGHSDDVTGVAFSPDGSRLATSSVDDTARVWDVASGKLLSTLSGHSDDVTGVAFSPDGSRLATSSVDNTARVWDVASSKLLSALSGHSDDVTEVAFSPDGSCIATSSVDNTARVWDAASGRLLSTLSGHSHDVTGVAFSPDGTRLATSSVDNTARVWDVASGKLLSTLSGHSQTVTDVAFSPDGKRLATASRDKTARVWDVASGKFLATLTGHSQTVTGVAFSPDGTRLATSSHDNTAIIWPMPPVPLALCNRIRNATRYHEVAEICEIYEPL